MTMTDYDQAHALAALYFRYARTLLFQIDNYGGGKPRSAKECASTIMQMAEETSPELWAALADVEDMQPPTPEAQAMAKGFVQRRCDWLRK